MHGVRGPKWAPKSVVGTPLQSIYVTQWGSGGNGSGPTGYKCKKARVHARMMADMAAQYRNRAKSSSAGLMAKAASGKNDAKALQEFAKKQ